MTDYSMKEPLSYEPLKSILANMCLETREKIALQMPTLQKTNDFVPYTFDSAHFTEESKFKVKIQDGTRIRKLDYDDLPKGLEEKNYKIYISELSMFGDGEERRGMNVEKFQKLLPMIKDSIPLKKVALNYDDETRPLFEDPLIKTCTELYIRYCHIFNNIEIGDLLHHLDNKHILLEIRNTRIWFDHRDNELIQNLARHWINTEKSAGRTFTFPHNEFSFISDIIFDQVDTYQHLGARITEIWQLGYESFASCAVIPMNENLEIVVFGTNYWDGTRNEGMDDLKYALNMEIRARGSTSASGYFE